MKELIEKLKTNKRYQRIVDTIVGVLIAYVIVGIGFKLIF
jgi:uncharacterized membrane protein